MARPMPLAPPVTTAARPCSHASMRGRLVRGEGHMQRRDVLRRVFGLAALGLASACVPPGPPIPPTATPAPAAGKPAAAPTTGPPTAQVPAPTTAPAAKTFGKIKLGWVAVSAANSAIWSADAGGYLNKFG